MSDNDMTMSDTDNGMQWNGPTFPGCSQHILSLCPAANLCVCWRSQCCSRTEVQRPRFEQHTSACSQGVRRATPVLMRKICSPSLTRSVQAATLDSSCSRRYSAFGRFGSGVVPHWHSLVSDAWARQSPGSLASVLHVAGQWSVAVSPPERGPAPPFGTAHVGVHPRSVTLDPCPHAGDYQPAKHPEYAGSDPERCHSTALHRRWLVSLSLIATHCHSLPLIATHCRCNSLSLPLIVIVTHCYSLLLIVTHCHVIVMSLLLIIMSFALYNDMTMEPYNDMKMSSFSCQIFSTPAFPWMCKFQCPSLLAIWFIERENVMSNFLG